MGEGVGLLPRGLARSMLFNRLRNWYLSARLPVLDWMQVEVTSFCNADCVYCPVHVFREHWVGRHLSLRTFEKLAPYFRRTKLLYLQGWGEPFLNPDLMQMVRRAKAAGCQVGTTTNGMALTDDKIAEVVESGMDILAFSLAGTDERNDEVRKGTKIEKVLDTLEHVQKVKEHLRKDTPAVHIAYMVLRSGLEQVERIPALLSGRGIAHVVISTLDFIPAQDLAEESFLWCDEEAHEAVSAKLAGVAAEGERRGLPVSFHLPGPVRKGTTCTEHIHRALFVGADGTVSPCVYRNIPVRGRRFAVIGSGEPYERLIFGNVEDDPLPAIWHGRSYGAFRTGFIGASPEGMCGSCPKRLSLPV